MLQHIQNLLKGEDSHQAAELEIILSELNWDSEINRYIGSQRALARITGIDRMTLRRGLGMDPNRTVSDPKILKWLVAEGMSGGSIQRQWADGQIHDTVIAKLITYAATEKEVPTAEGKRWHTLIASAGFRAVIHEMKGRGDLMKRAAVRGRNLVAQVKTCDVIQQQGRSYQTVRSNIVKGVTGKAPRHLCNIAKQQGIDVKNTWRDNACADSLGCVHVTEEIYGTKGVDLGQQMRQFYIDNGLWDGVVRFHDERMSVADAESLGKVDRKKVNQLRAANRKRDANQLQSGN